MGIPTEGIDVTVEGDLDLQGTLGISKEASVGFESIRVYFDVRAPQATEGAVKRIAGENRTVLCCASNPAAPPENRPQVGLTVAGKRLVAAIFGARGIVTAESVTTVHLPTPCLSSPQFRVRPILMVCLNAKSRHSLASHCMYAQLFVDHSRSVVVGEIRPPKRPSSHVPLTSRRNALVRRHRIRGLLGRCPGASNYVVSCCC